MDIERILNALRKVWQTLTSELPEVAQFTTRLSGALDGTVDALGKLATQTAKPTQTAPVITESNPNSATANAAEQ